MIITTDQRDTKLQFHVVVDGVDCPVHVPDDAKARNLAGWATVASDLSVAKKQLQLLSVQSDTDVQHAIWITAVTFYVRCFVSGGVMLSENDHLKGISPTLRAFHDSLIAMRMNYTAHAGANEHQLVQVCVALNPDTNDRKIVQIGYLHARRISPMPTEVDEFLSLIKELEAVVSARIKKSEEHLIQTADIDRMYLDVTSK
jgi:hypothetical protein